MVSLSYTIFICILLSLSMMLPLMEKKTRSVVLFMMIGIVSCPIISEINDLLLNVFQNNFFFVTTTITPITEELIKALPILYYALAVSDDRRALMSNAYAVGIGFALMDHITILMQDAENISVFWAVFRGFGSGLIHGICTVMVGYGISYVRKQRKLFFTGTFALLSMAITYHATYNLIGQTAFAYAGIFLPLLSYIPAIILYQQDASQRKKPPAQD